MKLTRPQLEKKLTDLVRKVARLEKKNTQLAERLDLLMISANTASNRAEAAEARANAAELTALKKRTRRFESHGSSKWPDGWRVAK